MADQNRLVLSLRYLLTVSFMIVSPVSLYVYLSGSCLKDLALSVTVLSFIKLSYIPNIFLQTNISSIRLFNSKQTVIKISYINHSLTNKSM